MQDLAPFPVPGNDPVAAFAAWYGDAVKAEPNDPNAMALATAGPDGMPAVRMVLLKDFGAEGFTFYTNYESRKADHLAAHPRAALCFYWKSLRRQIRVEGDAAPVAAEISDAYYATRPRESRLGAWGSLQSRPLPNRAALEARMADYGTRFPEAVPRPDHWGGFRLTPRLIEFWRHRDNRLHDRIAFTRQTDGNWTSMLLYP